MDWCGGKNPVLCTVSLSADVDASNLQHAEDFACQKWLAQREHSVSFAALPVIVASRPDVQRLNISRKRNGLVQDRFAGDNV